MQGSVVKIGYCPTKRNIFDPVEPYTYNEKIVNTVRDIDPHISFVFADDILEKGLLDELSQVEALIRRFRDEQVDALFIPHCNFGSECLVAKVAAALRVPVLLWGPRDDAPDEKTLLRGRDSQCGLFATGKVLRHYNVPFTYLINSPVESDYFKNGLIRFAAVANVVKKFRSMRILQISTRPTPFMSVICNEGELLEKFGIEIIPVAMNELIMEYEQVLREQDPETKAATALLENDFSAERKGDDALGKAAAIKTAIKRLMARYLCTGGAIQCWDALYQITGVLPCYANAMLADEGLPVFCETDVCGTVSAIMLQAAAFDEQPRFFADITVRHPENDNAELLWHCGPFPPSLKSPDCAGAVSGSYTLENHEFGVCEWKMRDGDVTVTRFDGDHGVYSLFIGEAKTTHGPENRGTYVWMEVDNWAKWERKLVEGPYIHHVAGGYGHCGEILAEACKYIPGLKVDFADRGEEIMERWG